MLHEGSNKVHGQRTFLCLSCALSALSHLAPLAQSTITFSYIFIKYHDLHSAHASSTIRLSYTCALYIAVTLAIAGLRFFVLAKMHINALHQRFTSICMTHTVHWADPVVWPNIGLGPSPATPGVVKSIKNNSGKQRRFVEMSARPWRCSSLSTASWGGLRSHPYTGSYVTIFITHCLWICHSKSLGFVFQWF